MTRPNPYATMFQRLVANVHEPESENGCWIWAGVLRHGYPSVCVRTSKGPRQKAAHRIMVEEVHDVDFPLDEAGHLCGDTRCINPDHLEVQTKTHNLSDRRGYGPSEGCWIPVLFPRHDPLDEAACVAWDDPGVPGDDCPF